VHGCVASARVGLAWLATLLVAPAALGQAPATDAAPAGTVEALWVEHDLRFTYFGLTTYYSCSGLREKVRYLMQQLGARKDDLRVRVSCLEPDGVEAIPSVRITAALPAAATPETLARLEREAPQRELKARAGARGQGTDAALARFPARLETVEFTSTRAGSRIGDGDCELIEHFVRYVFPPLGLRLAEGSRLSCVPRQVSIGAVRVKVEALRAVPEPAAPRG
jgi:hypothetical protein